MRVYGEYVSGLKADGVEMGPWRNGLGHGYTEAGVWKNFYNDAQILAGKQSGTLHVDLEAHADVPSLEKIINKDYPPYHQIIPDQYRVEVFLKEFNEYVRNGNLPDLVVMALTSDHTNGLTPNYPTPRAMVADNDLALGRVIEAISKSPYWKDSAIFVIEDDAQNGVDHVDGHRTIGFVASAYTKRGRQPLLHPNRFHPHHGADPGAAADEPDGHGGGADQHEARLHGRGGLHAVHGGREPDLPR